MSAVDHWVTSDGVQEGNIADTTTASAIDRDRFGGSVSCIVVASSVIALVALPIR
jgi:hypothetical protein